MSFNKQHLFMPEKLHFISFDLQVASPVQVDGIDSYDLSTPPNMFFLPPFKGGLLSF